MEELAKQFLDLARSAGLTRLKVKFQKPVTDGFKVEVFNGDQEVLELDYEDGNVENVDYKNGRRDRFDDGKIEKIRFHDRNLKMRFKDGVWNVDAEFPDGTNFNDMSLNLDPKPGHLNETARIVLQFLLRKELSDFDFENERVEFEDKLNVAAITVGKGRKAKVYRFVF